MQKTLKIFAFIFILIINLWLNKPLCAEDKTPVSGGQERSQTPETKVVKNSKESLMNSGFVMETDDQSSAESLERISGKIDMGFSSPENSYKTEERPGAGPFAKEKAEEKKQTSSAY